MNSNRPLMRARKHRNLIRQTWVVPLAISMVMSCRLLLDVNVVKGFSMMPTLHPGDTLLSLRVGASGRAAFLHPGAIVVARQPADNTRVVKRIIASPFSTLMLEGNRAEIDGNVTPEPYVANANRMPSYENVVLEAGKYFLCGDNRLDSTDSRQFGPVDRRRIEALVMIRISFERTAIWPNGYRFYFPKVTMLYRI